MSEITAQVSKRIDASPTAIWTALTTPSRLKQFFFGADIDSDFRVGSKIAMRGSFNGKNYEDKGEILRAEKEHLLEFSHWSGMSGLPDKPENYHVVTFDLQPDGDGTTVTLFQSNLQGGVKDSDRAHKAEYEKNWQTVLDGLAKTVETERAST